MAWVKLDDSFSEHPKFQKVGPLGVTLFVLGLAYCNRNLTDGLIPERQALSDAYWSTNSGLSCSPQELVNTMIEAKLWEVRSSGYYIHDYHKYQNTKADMLAFKARQQAAGQAGGQASAQARAQASNEAQSKPKTQTQYQSKTKDKKKDTVHAPRALFTPPSLDEVKAYCLERGRGVDPEAWMNHYEANGWRVGRNPMKSWKASVRYWETNPFGNAPLNGAAEAKDPYADAVAEGMRLRKEREAQDAKQ